MNSFRSLNGERESRIGLMFAAGLAALFLVCLMGAGKAQASTVFCGGSVESNTEGHAEGEMTYKVTCNETVVGYTITSNREIGYFGTETVVLKPDDEVMEGESFTCEGGIPSWGVGCFGKMSATNSVVSGIATTEDICEAAVQPRFWVSAMVVEDVKGKATYVVSEPFLLKTEPCDVLQPMKKAEDKRDKLCAKVADASSKKARTKARKACKAAIKAVKQLKAA